MNKQAGKFLYVLIKEALSSQSVFKEKDTIFINLEMGSLVARWGSPGGWAPWLPGGAAPEVGLLGRQVRHPGGWAPWLPGARDPTPGLPLLATKEPNLRGCPSWQPKNPAPEDAPPGNQGDQSPGLPYQATKDPISVQ